nr:putative reverse transcriptase domain-containing protein [Tanacetum cinerariifolium]
MELQARSWVYVGTRGSIPNEIPTSLRKDRIIVKCHVLSLEDKAHLTREDYNTLCFLVIDVVNKFTMYLWYVGPFKVLERVGDVAYKINLPEEPSRVHNTFHVSNLKKCHADEPLAVPLDGLHFDDKLHFVEEPVEIVDREVKRLKQSQIPLVKVALDDLRDALFVLYLTSAHLRGDEHLDTVLKTESDEFIKSSVANLFPNPSEFKGEYEYDVPACEDFTTFFNLLFDSDYDFSSIDSLFDEFASELTLFKSIPPEINETDCDPEEETRLIKRLLYDNSSPRPPEEFISENSDTSFESISPSPIPVEDSDSPMEEIDLSFTPDDPMSSGIKEDDYDSERDILILEELLSNDSLSVPENKSFHFDIPSSSRPPAKPPDGNSGILNVKVMGDIFEHKVSMPRLMFTQPTLVPNQEKSPKLLPHLGHEAS